MNKNPLKKIIQLQKAGIPVGIYSACSANEYVVKAVLKKAKDTNSVALIEATANQVDQNGGYTGMKPIDFYEFVMKIADEIGLAHQAIFLGGDHLGPLTWSSLNEDEAMKNAEELITQYIMAGFTKIHIDTSMKLADDNANERLSDEIIAQRGARLARVAHHAYLNLLKTQPDAIAPVYIVGSEVPIPGGAQGSNSNELQITTTDDLVNTINSFKQAFLAHQISELWDDVIAVVVQPGVEEKDSGCTEYDRAKAAHLSHAIKAYPSLVFEGHSTDYQTKTKLSEMIQDGIAILKVGPGLTFALREALFALNHIEEEWFKDSGVIMSQFIKVLDEAMLKNPSKWDKYYTGDAHDIALKRKYSFSDRCRYYFPSEEVSKSIDQLVSNFKANGGIPLHLMSQFMPIQYTKVREGVIANEVEALIIDRIMNTIDEYCSATQQHQLR